MMRTAYHIASIGLFTALAVALGYAFVAIPNIEMITLSVFLAGILLGSAKGFIVGFLAEFIFAVFNPVGMAGPQLLIGMVLGMALIGLAGGLFGKFRKTKYSPRILLFFTGVACTVLFDLLTTVSFALMTGLSPGQTAATYVAGAWFYLIHMLGNGMLFFLLIPTLSRLWQNTSCGPLREGVS
ncbi:MAG TPA: ECF transporter S component [bacterium]|nr:ECF transporter S component [bacterium]